ncbi:hypothetical protein L195_g040786, partial [Trifolium pratense]
MVHGFIRERALGIPLTLDEATMKRTFGHFAKVLIEIIGHFVKNCKYQTHKATTRSKEAMTYMFVGNVLNHEKEIPFISVEAVPVCVQDTSSWSDMASPIVDAMNLANEVFCEEPDEEVHRIFRHETSIVVDQPSHHIIIHH